jgi:hypothetical protein
MTGQLVGASAVSIRRAEYVQICAALGIFLLGALVYLFDRSGSDIYFIPEWWRLADGTPALFGALGYSLPSFAHAYCFILLINVLLIPWQIPPWTICIGWFAVEAVCELAQMNPVAGQIVLILPDWFSDWPILQNVPLYFLHGRFDPLDLALAGVGSVAAYLTILFSNHMRGQE